MYGKICIVLSNEQNKYINSFQIDFLDHYMISALHLPIACDSVLHATLLMLNIQYVAMYKGDKIIITLYIYIP